MGLFFNKNIQNVITSLKLDAFTWEETSQGYFSYPGVN